MRSGLQWAGHIERMADDRLPKAAAELRDEGRRRRGSKEGRRGGGKTERRRQETEGGKDYQMRR